MRLATIGRRLFSLFEPGQRRTAIALVPLMIVRAALDTIGVATVLPFIAVVADPDEALANRYLGGLYDWLGFASTNTFLIFLGCAALFALLFSNGLAVAVEYLVKRFVMRQSHMLQRRLMFLSLSRPYSNFLNAHSGEMGQSILSEVREFIEGVLSPYMLLVARLIATVVLLGLLVAVDPVLAFTTGAALAGLYVVIFMLVRRTLNRIGIERQKADNERYKTVSETYGGIKDVKVSGREQTFLERFTRAARRHATFEVIVHVTKVAPKYLLEVVAFSGIIGIILFLLTAGRPTTTVLSIVTLYAFACYRLIPAVQQIYEAISRLRYSMPALELIEGHIGLGTHDLSSLEHASPRPVTGTVAFNGVTYAYPNAEEPSLYGLELALKQGESTAIVGATGSGKTTALDILLGLLTPTSGEVLIDGEPLTRDRIRSWQAAVGYVPQHVFLSDDTVTRNIAFGVPSADIDHAAVERAARIAQIHQFVSTLPEGYETRIGERGVRLSGGQRQRLGIARALYHDPAVLVLDEATSALDSVTEEAVFDSLAQLAGSKTIVLVTHRLSTVRSCDQIILLENGRIHGRGTFDGLLESNVTFKALAERHGNQQTPAAATS